MYMHVNSLHVMGTFMCPHNASALREGHVYVPTDVVQSNEVNSEAKRAFRVNPFPLALREGRKGRC